MSTVVGRISGIAGGAVVESTGIPGKVEGKEYEVDFPTSIAVLEEATNSACPDSGARPRH